MSDSIVDDVGWLYNTDLRILRLLEPQELEMKPGHIRRNAVKEDGSMHSIDWVRERIYALEERDLLVVADPDARFYGITELGKQVARGEISAEELEVLAEPEEESTG